VLRECQDIVGYLPIELINYISCGMNLSSSEVFGIVTFYSLFSLEPKGRNNIKLCLGTACYVKGMREIMDRVSNNYKMKSGETTPDRRFSLEAVRCVGACGLAPVMVVNEDIHGIVSADKIVDILENYE
jgi:NADH:ubiquinone oxidoreductase subunit E